MHKQIVLQEIENLSESMKIKDYLSLDLLIQSLILGESPNSLDKNDIVDGNGDKQVDVITIENKSIGAVIYITQTTLSESFSANKLIKFKNGLEWIFFKKKEEISKLENEKLKDKIFEIKDILERDGWANISVRVNFTSLGNWRKVKKENAAREFREELKNIQEAYSNGIFKDFEISVLGAEEIKDLIHKSERKSRTVNGTLSIELSPNIPTIIEHDTNDLKGLICNVKGKEIAKLVNNNPNGEVFDLNIRQYLGDRGNVNREIRETATGTDSHEFWFLNNGITIVCDSFSMNRNPDNPYVKLNNLQIVNGCQTAATIANEEINGKLRNNVFVLTRIYQTGESDLSDKIVLTTNNQNRITNRNLRANDPIQIDLEKVFLNHGYYLERKPNQYKNKKFDTEKIINNELVGQSYLACVLKHPSDARSRKYKIWTELYDRIFNERQIEAYIFVALLVKDISAWLPNSSFATSKNDLKRFISRRGLFHISRIVAFKLIEGDKNWNNDSEIKPAIHRLEKKDQSLKDVYDESSNILFKILDDKKIKNELEKNFKSYMLEELIEKTLYSS